MVDCSGLARLALCLRARPVREAGSGTRSLPPGTQLKPRLHASLTKLGQKRREVWHANAVGHDTKIRRKMKTSAHRSDAPAFSGPRPTETSRAGAAGGRRGVGHGQVACQLTVVPAAVVSVDPLLSQSAWPGALVVAGVGLTELEASNVNERVGELTVIEST